MSQTSTESQHANLLALLKKSKGGRLKAGDLKTKLANAAKKGLELAEVDRTFAELIESGFVRVIGAKEGPHPRRNGTYELTDEGKNHLRPAKPKGMKDSQLEAQESFLLLLIFRAKGEAITRGEIRTKLDTASARGQLEFDDKADPSAVDYHLSMLAEKGLIEAIPRSSSHAYALKPDRGPQALATMIQHATVTFTLRGSELNALLAAARQAPSESMAAEAIVEHHPAEAPSSNPPKSVIGEHEIHQYIDQLKSDKYPGKDLIPIHEVRRLVAEGHGHEAASHAVFDPILRRMRNDGRFNLIAITDTRSATSEEMADAIPGLNETIFYIVAK